MMTFPTKWKNKRVPKHQPDFVRKQETSSMEFRAEILELDSRYRCAQFTNIDLYWLVSTWQETQLIQLSHENFHVLAATMVSDPSPSYVMKVVRANKSLCCFRRPRAKRKKRTRLSFSCSWI